MKEGAEISTIDVRRVSRRRQGLTLVETLIAMAILGLTLFAYLRTFTMSQKSGFAATASVVAVNEARRVGEELVEKTYDDPALSVGTHTLPKGSYTVALNGEFTTTKDIVISMPWFFPISTTTQYVTCAMSVTKCIHSAGQ